ncbi:MAG: PorP/SprF family type IX secretion system membrane protein [Bacteroidota bacterium]|nr:PorP/SprF family type IX secretion system membrane protein [Bacteroidota bacterium]
MKKVLFTLISATICTGVWAQGANQGLIQSTQFPVNTYMINPAYAGAEDYTSFQAAFKRNYISAPVQGPQTMYLSAHTRLQKDQKPNIKRESSLDTSDKVSGNVPMARGRSADKYKKRIQARDDSAKIQKMRSEMEYQKKFKEEKERLKYRPFHGIGGQVINESAAASTRTGLSATYAFHAYLTKQIRWSIGASLGFSSYSLNAPTFREANDPAAENINANVINPDVNFGTFLLHDKFYAGVATNSLIPQKQFNSSSANNTTKMMIMATGGYIHRFNDDFSLSPSLWLRYSTATGAPIGLDFNARAVYKIVWGGVTYRTLGGASGLIGIMAGVNIANAFDISLAYDYPLASYTNVYSGGGMEVILGYRLQRKNFGYQSRLFN